VARRELTALRVPCVNRAADAFHAAGLAHGWRDDGAPGLRPDDHPRDNAAFLLDLDGYRVDAVRHRAPAA
jgi:hypothetical protein